MEITHTGTVSLNEVLEAVRDLFRKDGYEPVFEKEHLEKLVNGRNVDVSLTLLNPVIRTNLKSGVEFHPHFIKEVYRRQQRLEIFFANIAPELVMQKVNEAFTSLDDHVREALISSFELSKPLKDVKNFKIGKASPYTVKKINESMSHMSKKLLDLFTSSIESLVLKSEILNDKTAFMKTQINECGLSVRVYNYLKSAGIDTVEALFLDDNKKLLSCRSRNFGEQSLREVQDFKVLMKLS